MPRHPGIQHEMRLKEVATQMAYASGDIQGSFNEIRHLEDKAAELKNVITAAQSKLNSLLELQTRLLECQSCTEFGLPSGMTTADFKRITGHEIDS